MGAKVEGLENLEALLSFIKDPQVRVNAVKPAAEKLATQIKLRLSETLSSSLSDPTTVSLSTASAKDLLPKTLNLKVSAYINSISFAMRTTGTNLEVTIAIQDGVTFDGTSAQSVAKILEYGSLLNPAKPHFLPVLRYYLSNRKSITKQLEIEYNKGLLKEFKNYK